MKWKCKVSGNIVDLPDSEAHTMEGHDGYELVEETKDSLKQPTKPVKSKKEVTE